MIRQNLFVNSLSQKILKFFFCSELEKLVWSSSTTNSCPKVPCLCWPISPHSIVAKDRVDLNIFIFTTNWHLPILDVFWANLASVFEPIYEATFRNIEFFTHSWKIGPHCPKVEHSNGFPKRKPSLSKEWFNFYRNKSAASLSRTPPRESINGF